MDGDAYTPARRLTVHRHDDALGTWTVATCTPRPELAACVAMLWYGEGQVRYQRDRILPSASSYLLINLGPRQYRIEAGPPERRIAFDDIWYSGLQHGPIDTEAPTGSTLLGVAFHPCGAWPWLGLDADALADRTTPLADVLGDGVRALHQRLLDTSTIAARIDLVERWLLARLHAAHGRTHPDVRHALQRIDLHQGQLGVQALARELGTSRKHLATLFRRQVGLTPKSLARVLRFQGALRMLQGAERVPWTLLAAQCGYYDQSHLIHDFRAFSGYTPGEFVGQARPDATSVVVR